MAWGQLQAGHRPLWATCPNGRSWCVDWGHTQNAERLPWKGPGLSGGLSASCWPGLLHHLSGQGMERSEPTPGHSSSHPSCGWPRHPLTVPLEWSASSPSRSAAFIAHLTTPIVNLGMFKLQFVQQTQATLPDINYKSWFINPRGVPLLVWCRKIKQNTSDTFKD